MPTDATPTIKQQARHARAEHVNAAVRMGEPWAIFIALTVMGNALYIALGKIVDHGEWISLTTALVLLCGIGLTAFDAHLRRYRMSAVGRAIGPVTIFSGTSLLSAFLLSGYSVPLMLIWAFGGSTAALGWGGWLHHAAHHDLAIGFTENAGKAGLGLARLAGSRKRGSAPALPGRPAVRARPRVSGRVVLDGGEVTPAEAADRAAQLEGAHHWPVGAASLVPAEDDGAAADFTLSDPSVLAVPLPWPGVYAEGADLSVPFRPGLYQDGEEWLYYLLPAHHIRSSGRTGSGKTQSWLWNFQAEAVTRQDYACFGFDTVKRMQFFGPLAEAMHGIAITPEEALEQYLALRRARVARLDYMQKHGLTAWKPGCGLTFLNSWMEEAPSILNQIARLSKGKSGSQVFNLDDWAEGVKADRSAGIRHDASMQFGKDTEFPTPARGQFGTLCFGTADRNESKIGLSPAQVQAGARPELWGSRFPGKAYADPGVASADPSRVAMALRLWYWGEDTSIIERHMMQYPAAGRPLDDVTGEAMEDRPADPPSYGYPGPGGTLPGAGRPGRTRGSTVVAGPWGQPKGDPRMEEAARAEQAVFSLWLKWYAEGEESFTVMDMVNAPEFKALGKSRPHVYNYIATGVQKGLCEKIAEKPKLRWRIIPPQERAEREEG